MDNKQFEKLKMEFSMKQAERSEKKNFDLVYENKLEKGSIGALIEEITMTGKVSECMSEIIKVIQKYLTYNREKDIEFLDKVNRKVWSFSGFPKLVNGSYSVFTTYNETSVKARQMQYAYNANDAQHDAVAIIGTIVRDGEELLTEKEKLSLGYKKATPRSEKSNEEFEGTSVKEVLESKKAPKRGK